MAAAGLRPLLAALSLIFLGASVLFQFFIILSGGTNGGVEGRFFFLRADTSNIPGAFTQSAWTYFAVCDYYSGKTHGCHDRHAALPFNPPENFHTTTGVPEPFIGTHYYYYMSRFSWAFYMIALFFSAIALFLGLLALCTRLGAFLSGATTLVAWFFEVIAVSLMTAWTVKARDHFNNVRSNSAHLGKYTMGFSWASTVLLFLSLVLFFVSGGTSRDPKTTTTTYTKKSRFSKFGKFGRKRSTRSRGDFSETETAAAKEDEPLETYA